MTLLNNQQIHDFQETVWAYFAAHKRSMPWRDDQTPYHVWVSELMLQQTQVNRVLPKYQAFIAQFPDVQALASASLADVLTAWNGLGYNRRAKFLHMAAQRIVQEYGGTIPNTKDELVKLPGIGANTAGAILAYAFNQPALFIETNIRTVLLQHFFANQDTVTDKQLLEVLAQTIDAEHPRQWYWALMDYGTHLKTTVGGQISRSAHYKKQSKFEGSRRQLRGEVIRQLTQGVFDAGNIADDRLDSVIDELLREQFIERIDGQIRLHGGAVAAIIATDETA